MEFRVYIPDSPRRAWQALKYYVGARKSPVKVYGIEDMRDAHRKHMATNAEFRSAQDQLTATRTKLIEARKEISRLKRGMGTGWDQNGIANPDAPGSIPAHASKT